MFVIHAFQWHVAGTLQCRQSENSWQKYLSLHLIPTIYIWPFSSLAGEIVFCSLLCLFDVILLMSWAQWYFVRSCYARLFPSFFSSNPFFFLRFFLCVSVCVNPVRLIHIRKQADAINWDLSADCRLFWISRYSVICRIFSENHNLQHKIQTRNGMTCSMCMSFVVIYIF